MTDVTKTMTFGMSCNETGVLRALALGIEAYVFRGAATALAVAWVILFKTFLACIVIYSIVWMSFSIADMVICTPGLLADGARLVKKLNDTGYYWVVRFTIICVGGVMGALAVVFLVSQLVTLLLVLSAASISLMLSHLYSFSALMCNLSSNPFRDYGES